MFLCFLFQLWYFELLLDKMAHRLDFQINSTKMSCDNILKTNGKRNEMKFSKYLDFGKFNF